MKTSEEICRQLARGEFEFSRHAFKRVVERNIGDAEIREAGDGVKIIEDYPADKYAPSCLLLGFTKAGRPLHLQASYVESELVKIITIYEPDEAEWYNNYSKRR